MPLCYGRNQCLLWFSGYPISYCFVLVYRFRGRLSLTFSAYFSASCLVLNVVFCRVSYHVSSGGPIGGGPSRCPLRRCRQLGPAGAAYRNDFQMFPAAAGPRLELGLAARQFTITREHARRQLSPVWTSVSTSRTRGTRREGCEWST